MTVRISTPPTWGTHAPFRGNHMSRRPVLLRSHQGRLAIAGAASMAAVLDLGTGRGGRRGRGTEPTSSGGQATRPRAGTRTRDPAPAPPADEPAAPADPGSDAGSSDTGADTGPAAEPAHRRRPRPPRRRSPGRGGDKGSDKRLAKDSDGSGDAADQSGNEPAAPDTSSSDRWSGQTVLCRPTTRPRASDAVSRERDRAAGARGRRGRGRLHRHQPHRRHLRLARGPGRRGLRGGRRGGAGGRGRLRLPEVPCRRADRGRLLRAGGHLDGRLGHRDHRGRAQRDRRGRQRRGEPVLHLHHPAPTGADPRRHHDVLRLRGGPFSGRPPGSTLTFRQLAAAAGLVADPTVYTLPPCEERSSGPPRTGSASTSTATTSSAPSSRRWSSPTAACRPLARDDAAKTPRRTGVIVIVLANDDRRGRR